MLSPEQNAQLTQVGAGTPMGELLRRYWMPIAGVSEFDHQATKAMRLLGVTDQMSLFLPVALSTVTIHKASALGVSTVTWIVFDTILQPVAESNA